MVKRRIISTIALFINAVFFSINLKSQVVPLFKPNEIGWELNFSEDLIKNFNSPKAFEACEKVYKLMRSQGRSWDQATLQERKVLSYCHEIKDNVWDIVGSGCSWYCGGGAMDVTASSSLAGQGSNNYDAKNAHDLSFKNAWVEGVEGYGIGENLTYYFSPESPRVTEVIVVNGYVKSESAFVNNSRVKKLRVYYNDQAIGDLILEDVRAEQHFKLGTFGYSDRDDLERLKLKEPWTLKFEILEVYKGAKFEDTAISEIYFDGIDVH